jgi:hypothetical protein
MVHQDSVVLALLLCHSMMPHVYYVLKYCTAALSMLTIDRQPASHSYSHDSLVAKDCKSSCKGCLTL